MHAVAARGALRGPSGVQRRSFEGGPSALRTGDGRWRLLPDVMWVPRERSPASLRGAPASARRGYGQRRGRDAPPVEDMLPRSAPRRSGSRRRGAGTGALGLGGSPKALRAWASSSLPSHASLTLSSCPSHRAPVGRASAESVADMFIARNAACIQTTFTVLGAAPAVERVRARVPRRRSCLRARPLPAPAGATSPSAPLEDGDETGSGG